MTKNLQAKLRALGNIGDIFSKMNDTEEALKMYHRQFTLARQIRDTSMEAAACSSLGLANRYIKCYDKALSYHCQVENTQNIVLILLCNGVVNVFRN